jgi:hypothetical protein
MLLRASLPALLALQVFAGVAGAATLDALVATPAGKPLPDAAVVLEPLGARGAGGQEPPARRHRTARRRIRSLCDRDPDRHRGRLPEQGHGPPPRLLLLPAQALRDQAVRRQARPADHLRQAGRSRHRLQYPRLDGSLCAGRRTPYFGKTGADGQVRIANLPAGRYRLQLWHPLQKARVAASEIDIAAASPRLNLVLDARAREPRPHTEVDQDRY